MRRLCLALIAALALVLPALSAPPPNIVVIFADDLGYGDLGCFGHPSIRTPNLDRMAAEGMRFTDFYSAAEVCTPSRAALLTGRYPVRSGMCHDRFRVLRAQSTGHLPESEITLAEQLKTRGYATAFVGKWHLGVWSNNPAGHPSRHGFDHTFGLPHSNDMNATPAAPRGAPARLDQDPAWWNSPLWRDDTVVEQPTDQSTLTRRYTEEAVRFISQTKDAPFFLYFAHTFPHVPLFASEPFRGKSPRGLYGDVVEELDWSVGRVLDALKSAGVERNTLVVFTSDNGPWLTQGLAGGSAGLLREGKGSTWEGGMRVPALAWWPGTVPAGSVCRDVVCTMDLFPTCSALAGASLPADRAIDGTDVSALLRGGAAPVREPYFFHRGTRLFAVRTGRWKTHFLTQPGYGSPKAAEHEPPLLYDVQTDPSESVNVAAQHPEVVAQARAAVEKFRATLVPAPTQMEATVADAAALPAPAKPNIVFILCDDLGWGDLRCLNSQAKIPTPHADRLAREGMVFTDCHSSSAVCTPTRYGLLTGRYNWRSRLKKGVLGGMSPPLLEPGRPTVASFLKEQGWRTAAIGKWHLGMEWTRQPAAEAFGDDIEKGADGWRVDFTAPIQRGPLTAGFDEFFGIAASLDMVPYAFIEGDRVTDVPTTDKDFPMMEGRRAGRTRRGPAAADFEAVEVLPRLVDRAVHFISQQASEAEKGTPFFLYLPLASPHTPIVPSADWAGRSGLNPYADFVMQTDAALGAVLDALDRGGVADRTLVIFTSDNGCSPQANFNELRAQGHDPSGPFRGTKADIFEGGHRVPFLARWPGRVKPGSRTDQLACLNDFFATCAEIAGKKLPSDAAEDSVSLLPVLEGRATASVREALVHHSINGSFAIRQGHWKLALCPDSGGWSDPKPGAKTADLPAVQLYDLEADPAESRNVQADHPDVVAKLRALLEKYRAEGRSVPPAL